GLSHVPQCVLLVDYDGTLAPFDEKPERAHLYPEVADALDRLIEGGRTRVVIVSGRELNDLLPLLPFRRRPEVWGSHGWQRLMPDGKLVVREPDAAVRNKLDAAERLARDLVVKGARLERKAASVALHWRGLSPDIASVVHAAARNSWETLARDRTVELMD